MIRNGIMVSRYHTPSGPCNCMKLADLVYSTTCICPDIDASSFLYQHITDVMHPCDMDIRTHVSVNSARWMPGSGEGIVYGTNRGDLHVCRPG